MPRATEIVNFNVRTGNGPQNIPFSDASFSAIGGGVIFFTTTPLLGDAYAVSIGYDDGTTRAAGVTASGYVFGTDDAEHGWSNYYSMMMVMHSFAFEWRFGAYITSLNVGSIDIQVDNNSTPGASWTAIVFGNGAKCKVGHIQGTNFNVTLPFKPAALVGQFHVGAPGTLFTGGGILNFGFAVADNNRQCSFGGTIQGLTAPSNTKSAQRYGKYLSLISGSSIGNEWTVALNATGFVVSGPSVGVLFMSYFAIGGPVNAEIISFDQPTSTGTFVYPLKAQTPDCLLIASINKRSTDNVEDDFLVSFGAGNVANQKASRWAGDQDNTNPPWMHFRNDTTKVLLAANPTALSASTIAAQADLLLISHQAKLTWSVTDLVPRRYIGLAIGIGAAFASEPEPSTEPPNDEPPFENAPDVIGVTWVEALFRG